MKGGEKKLNTELEFEGERFYEMGLDATSTLPDIIHAYTEEKATLKEITFPEFIKQTKQDQKSYQKNLQRTAERLVKEIPFDHERVNLEKALDEIVEEYVCSEFGLKYARLSEDLFDIKRNIEYNLTDGKNYNIQIPLLVSVELIDDYQSWIFDESKFEGGNYDRKEYKIKIESKRPPLSSEAKEKAKIAKSEYLDILSKALKVPVIGDLLMRKPIPSPVMRLYWIPKPSELNIEVEVIDRDPLLTTEPFGRKYFVANWDVEGEEPIEHYIREFSEGKLNF